MKRFENELLRQLSLISYDRGRILSEQNPDPLGRDKDNILIRTASKTTDKDVKVYNRKKAREVYNKIVREIDGSWFPRFDGYKWDWGTDEEGLTDAVLSIENKNQLDFIKTLLFIKYPEYRATDGSLLKFIQNMEFSMAMKDDVRKEWLNNNEDVPIEGKLNPITMAQLVQYYFNDSHLLQMKYHLQRFDKNENLEEVKETKGLDVVFANILNPVTSASNLLSPNLLDKFLLAISAILKDGRIRTLYGVLFISAVLRISYCCSAVCPLINFFVLNNSSIVGIKLYFMLVPCYSYFSLFFQLEY